MTDRKHVRAQEYALNCEHCDGLVLAPPRTCDECDQTMCPTCEDLHDDQGKCPLKLLQQSGPATDRIAEYFSPEYDAMPLGMAPAEDDPSEHADRMHAEGRCSELAPCEHGWPGCSAPSNCPKCVLNRGRAEGVAACVDFAEERARYNEGTALACRESGNDDEDRYAFAGGQFRYYAQLLRNGDALATNADALSKAIAAAIAPHKEEAERYKLLWAEAREACVNATQGPWVWMDTSEDDLGSLVESAAITITAGVLRSRIAAAHEEGAASRHADVGGYMLLANALRQELAESKAATAALEQRISELAEEARDARKMWRQTERERDMAKAFHDVAVQQRDARTRECDAAIARAEAAEAERNETTESMLRACRMVGETMAERDQARALLAQSEPEVAEASRQAGLPNRSASPRRAKELATLLAAVRNELDPEGEKQ